MDRKHILVVDDEKALRSLIRDYLIKADYFVSEAVNENINPPAMLGRIE